MSEFAQEVFDFCPDTLEQGVVKPVSTDMDWEDIDELLAEQTPADLADFLQRDEQRLFLWWD